MIYVKNPPPGAPASGSPKCSQLGSGNSSDPTKSSPDKQQAFASLQKEFVCECLRIVALKAAHAADNFELGDDLSAERDLGIVVAHIREAAAAFRELQRLAGGGQ